MKKTFLTLAALLLVGAGCASASADAPSTPPPQPSVTQEQSPPPSEPKTYAMSDVATHKDAASCWAVIRGDVYDLTAWIGRHPGGPGRILGICGIDATAAFDAKHEGSGRPESTLVTFKIGALKK